MLTLYYSSVSYLYGLCNDNGSHTLARFSFQTFERGDQRHTRDLSSSSRHATFSYPFPHIHLDLWVRLHYLLLV